MATWAQAEPLPLDPAHPMSRIGRHWAVLEDPSGRLSLTDVQRSSRWTEQLSADLNFGYSPSAFWLRAELSNTQTSQQEWILGLRYPLIDYLDVYFVEPDGQTLHHATGDRRPFGTRTIEDRNFFFPFQLGAGHRLTVYIRLQSQGSIQAPLTIQTPQAWRLSTAREHVLLGMYSGALLALLVYNLLLYISLRGRTYLYYVLYLASFGLAQMVFNGMAYQYLWPNWPDWGNRAAPFMMGLTGALLTQFGRDFLALKIHWPRADKVVRWTMTAFILVAFAGLWMDYTVPIRVGTLCTILSPALYLFVAAVMLRRGQRQAVYFLAAFGGLLVGVALAALQAYSVIGTSLLTEYGLQIGSVLEITLLSFALAHRLKLAQEANERMQLAHAAELEERVQQRTADLDQAMKELTDANARLQALTVRDALTGLHNRQYLNDRLPEVWRQALRWNQSLAVLMIDIDHFKQVNDRHGHAAGDQALRLVAQTLARLLGRPGDLAVRYGGEEFLVVLPQTNLAGAAHIAETIRQCVEGLEYQANDTEVKLTVSIGVASCIPGPCTRIEDLLHTADQLLYQAKRDGRNRCAVQGHTELEASISPEPKPVVR
ncbi:MAG TPA: diguanylate cyclase [Aquabacterium sp.]|nr:diguanylate cyclase [Aquabacterium sp.]